MATDVTQVRREDVRPIPKGIIPYLKPVIRLVSRLHVWLFRRTQGRRGARMQGAPICLVTMTGRKTGKRRTIPLMYIPHGDDVLLIASQAGMDFHPSWYWNIHADPHIEVVAEGRTRQLVAREANDDEKAALWPVAVAVYPDYDDYQARTDRDIPLLICSPE